MRWSKGLIIVLVIALAGIIAYTIYLYLGPYKRISRENRQLNDEIAELRLTVGELDVVKASVARKIRALEDLEAKTQGLEARISKTEGERETALEEADQLRKSLEQSKNRLSDLSQALAATEEACEARRKIDQARIVALKRDTQEKAERIAGLERLLQRERGEYGQRIQNLEALVGQRDRRIEALEREGRELRHTVAGLKTERDVLIQEKAELERGLEGSRSRVEVLSRQIAALEDTTESLSREKNEFTRQLDESKSRVQALSDEIAAKENRLTRVRESENRLIEKLTEQIQKKELEISTLQEKLRIRFLGKILFDPGNAVIKPRGRKILNRVATELNKLPETMIHVEGHTDNLPLSAEARAVYIDNLGLSTARAVSVVRILRTMGVRPALLSAAGYSMYRPATDNTTPEGREQNRRVEIILTPED